MTSLSQISPISLEPGFATRFLRLPRCKKLDNQENLNKIMVQTKFGTILAEREREREREMIFIYAKSELEIFEK